MNTTSTYKFECICGKWKEPIELRGPIGPACCIKCQCVWSVQWDVEIVKEREKAKVAAMEAAKVATK
jgi:hypothetical protein